MPPGANLSQWICVRQNDEIARKNGSSLRLLAASTRAPDDVHKTASFLLCCGLPPALLLLHNRLQASRSRSSSQNSGRAPTRTALKTTAFSNLHRKACVVFRGSPPHHPPPPPLPPPACPAVVGAVAQADGEFLALRLRSRRASLGHAHPLLLQKRAALSYLQQRPSSCR